MSVEPQFPRGSEWRKWDLHIHTPCSILYNEFPHKPNGEPDWDAYISAIEKLDICALGVTDYFTIEGYKKVREFKAAGRLKNIELILPNIEFRLKTIVTRRKDAKEIRLNFHVLFSDQVSEKDIEEHFLHDIPFYYQADPQNRVEKRKLKISNLEDLGQELIKQHSKFAEMNLSPVKVGAMQAVVGEDEIIELLSSSRFRGKYLVLLPADGWNDISWDGQAHLVRKGLLQKADMVLSPNQDTRNWCLGKPPYNEGPDQFRKEFSTLKPCVHGSDSHTLTSLGNCCQLRGTADHNCELHPDTCVQRYCWIKADTTFEGLKQLLYEPEDRVAIQAKNPTPLKSNLSIRGFRFDGSIVNDELSLGATNLPLNIALVAVTGGKGAGKTAFVDLIANCFEDRCKSADPNSFARRIVADGSNFPTAITFADGSLFEKSLADPRFVEESEIVYIAQGELERYIGESSDLDKYIRNLIFESPEVKDTVKSFEFDRVGKRSGEIEIEIHQVNQSIEKLEARTAVSVLANANREKTQVEAELRDVESKIPELEARLTPEKVTLIHSKQTARSASQARKQQLIELADHLTAASVFVSEDIARLNAHVFSINTLLRQLNILDTSLPELTYPSSAEIARIQATVTSELEGVVRAIEESERELRSYQVEMQDHARYLSRKNELLSKSAAVKQKLDAIADETTRLQEARAHRATLFTELLRTNLLQQRKYADIIDIFASNKAKVLSDLGFQARIQFKRTEMLKGLADVLDKRRVQVFEDEQVPSRFENLQKLYAQLAAGEEPAVDLIVAEVESLCDELKPKIKDSRAISPESLYRCLYGAYLSVTPAVTYKNTALNKLSLGQKATVLLKIYLAQGTNPIVIDSHDDHLDNEFIMDELVGAIREAKQYRQVILASNNGNVVINSDAEQVIIARRENGRVSYTSGSLENPLIRDRALAVLEGGAQAFKRRQEKYRLGA